MKDSPRPDQLERAQLVADHCDRPEPATRWVILVMMDGSQDCAEIALPLRPTWERSVGPPVPELLSDSVVDVHTTATRQVFELVDRIAADGSRLAPEYHEVIRASTWTIR